MSALEQIVTRLDSVQFREPVNAACEFSAEFPVGQLTGESQHVDTEVPKFESWRRRPSPEHLRQQQKQSPAGGVQSPVRLQIKQEMTTDRLDQFDEQRIPDKPPDTAGRGIQRQAVTQKPKTDFAMLFPHRVVKRIVLIGNDGQPFESLGELPVLASATA